MKIVFVYWGYENAGSMLDLKGYARAAETMGHEVIIYGPANPTFALDYSQDLNGTDAIVFVVEWTTQLQFGDRVDWVRLLEAVPPERRVVIDCDGCYNDPLEYAGDYNHKTEKESRDWIEFCDSLTSKIYQPTPRPLRPNVKSFYFHIYDKTWETPFDFSAKDYSMIYVGHTKFRWHGMSQVLHALEPVRHKAGRIGLVGEGWDAPLEWTEWEEIKDNYYVDRDYLKRLDVEALPPVPFAKVIETMERGVFNPVIYRPLFEHLHMVTCRTFETIAGGTIPLFLLDRQYVKDVFGDAALELVLSGDKASSTIEDVLERPDYYADIVHGIRKEFAKLHTPEVRLARLIEIIEE